MPATTSHTRDNLKVLVTGANGQVGKELRHLAPHYPSFQFLFQSREDLPLQNFEMIRTVLQSLQPDVVINCAAYTAVDQAEQDSANAFQVNGEAVGVMAAICAAQPTRFIHISTDYVFPGNGQRPYVENDPTGPINVYGASKLAGEEQAMLYNPDSLIVRTSWVYAAHGKNFVRTMVRLMNERPFVAVVNDQLGSPTYAADLAKVLMTLAIMPDAPGGIYHFANAGTTSWFHFAQAIATRINTGCEVRPIPSSAFPTPAQRPAYSVLNCEKITKLTGISPRPWEAALEECLNKLLT